MSLPMLLGQSVEVADKGLSLLERVQAGGVPLICLIVTVACAYLAYTLLQRMGRMQDDAAIEAKNRETTGNTLADKRVGEQAGLMREMLERDRQAQEAHLASIHAMEGFTSAIQELTRKVEQLTDRIEDLERALRKG